MSRESALKEHNTNRVTKKIKEWAEKYIEATVKGYDQYLTGDVYGYVIKDKDEQIDSCWGFYGLDYVIESAKEAVA
jgi:hypothetical protein